ncbi:MAG: fumarylacetoacetate hydrolase family protein [Candidatus Binatia bacterium]
MKLATIKPNDLAVIKNDGLIPLGEAFARENALAKGSSMLDLIAGTTVSKTCWKAPQPTTLVSYLSQVTTLYPGDLISTGNPDAPEFQQKLKPGDVVKSEIEGIGAMSLGVAKQS